MKLEYKTCDCLCVPELFLINGKEADYTDFVEKEDVCPIECNDHHYDYCCCNMKATIRNYSDGGRYISKICYKYGITEKEYFTIGKLLEKELSFGVCGLCE